MMEYKRYDYDSYVEKDKPKERTPIIVEKIATTRVNVRAAANLNGNIVRVLEKGERIKVYPTNKEWSKTEDNNYIMTKFIK